MRSAVLGGLVAAAVLGLSATAGAAGTLKADYGFEGNNSSSVGGAPDLANLGASNTIATESVGGCSTQVLTFPEDNGLSLDTSGGLTPQDRYTVMMQLRLAGLGSPYVRLLAFDGANPPGVDEGLYLNAGKLDFFDNFVDHEGATPAVAAGQYAEVALTRSSAAEVVGYVNGVHQFSYDDSGNDVGFLSNNAIVFFRDDGFEESAGAVARIRVYDDALTAAEVAAAATPGCSVSPPPVATTPKKKCKKGFKLKKVKGKLKCKRKKKKR